MPGSLTYSSRGGAIVSQIPHDFPTPLTTDALYTGKPIDLIGADPDGVAPENQIIGIESDIALTVPKPPFSPRVFKQGQRVSILNVGIHPITFLAGSFNLSSKAEVLEPAEMISLIFMPLIGWIPCDDDGENSQLPKSYWSGSEALPANGRVRFTEKGLLLKKGNLAAEPTARLETSSLSTSAKVFGGNIALDTESHTAVLGGGNTAIFTLPNPTTCPGREYRLVSEINPISLVVTGGSKVTEGSTTQITTVAAGKGLTIQSINGLWRKVGGF
jgi:hypothetical protein